MTEMPLATLSFRIHPSSVLRNDANQRRARKVTTCTYVRMPSFLTPARQHPYLYIYTHADRQPRRLCATSVAPVLELPRHGIE